MGGGVVTFKSSLPLPSFGLIRHFSTVASCVLAVTLPYPCHTPALVDSLAFRSTMERHISSETWGLACSWLMHWALGWLPSLLGGQGASVRKTTFCFSEKWKKVLKLKTWSDAWEKKADQVAGENCLQQAFLMCCLHGVCFGVVSLHHHSRVFLLCSCLPSNGYPLFLCLWVSSQGELTCVCWLLSSVLFVDVPHLETLPMWK